MDAGWTDHAEELERRDALELAMKRVVKETKKVVAAQTGQRVAILRAHEIGASTREIARAAGVSHTQVQRLIRTDQT